MHIQILNFCLQFYCRKLYANQLRRFLEFSAFIQKDIGFLLGFYTGDEIRGILRLLNTKFKYLFVVQTLAQCEFDIKKRLQFIS